MITAPQGGVPFVDEDRTPSNSALIFLQELRNAVSSGGGGGGSTIFPLRAPDGSASTPSYSWSNEPASGFYRVSLGSFRFVINGHDVIALLPYTLSAGGFPVSGDPTTFYYPTFNSNPATGFTIKAGRLQVGLEVLSGTQGLTQSPTSWPALYLSNAMGVASVAITSQIGAQSITTALRTSDFRLAFGATSQGSGNYFFALNDDTTGNPIVSTLNPWAARAPTVGGTTQCMQVDINNSGAIVDVSPISPANGRTAGILFTAGTAGVPSASLNNASVAWSIGAGNSAAFRKGFVVYNGGLDTSIGVFGGGIFGDLPIGASVRWMDGGGVIQNELGATVNGCGPINALKAGSLGIWPGIGDGGTVSQITSIATAVTLNKICGQITTVSNAFTAGTIVDFQVNNTFTNTNDIVILNGVSSGGNRALVYANGVGPNSFVISINPLTTGSFSLTITFMVIKGTIT